MQSLIHLKIEELLRAAGVNGIIELQPAPKPEMGDIAFPCFALSKEKKSNPAAVAKELEAKINTMDLNATIVKEVRVFGPYVNFFVSGEKAVALVVDAIEKNGNDFGNTVVGTGKKVLIEYPSNNTHKEFHIGHFRNVCIGNVLVNLYERSGFTTYPVNYLNDFGAHVAKCLWGLQKFHAGEQPPENKQKWLGEIYVEASRYVKEHPEVADEVGALQQKLEAHDESVWPLFTDTRQWSIDKFEELFKELLVRHVAVFYEKDVKQDAQRTVDELLAKGIATVGEGGAIIIDLTQYGLDIALVRKSNGVGLYLTSDLPLAKEKFKQFDVDESIIITGQEQNFYFRQLYKILELIGFQKKLTHIGYGLVNTAEGKMSSRLGNVVLYEDLRNDAYATVYAETKERHPDWEEAKLETVAKKLAMAALKFDMQKHEAAKNIVFDLKEATSFSGFSGPYVLYVVARINSILRKAAGEFLSDPAHESAVMPEASPEEKRLAILLADFPVIVTKALGQYNPSVIARYCFDLAQAFNEFYNKQSILNAESAGLVAMRLKLAAAVKQVLSNALGVLTIEVVEEM